MKSNLIPRRYALALYEVAEENNSLASVEKDITAIRQIFDQIPQVRDYCFQSHGDTRFAKDLVETTFFPYIGRFTKEMLAIAVKNKRLAVLPFLPGAFDNIRDEKNNIVSIVLETAHPLSGEMVSLIAEKMKNKVKKEIQVRTMVNPELLAGFRIHWHHKILDRSAAGRLQDIRKRMQSETFKVT